mmetsp:Transcript_16266/g.22477  ORF Transcript_16266/g.22477 Transcript_16266/m.22477 type:complete len:280 (+) Transcript_16266:320-1159(+)
MFSSNSYSYCLTQVGQFSCLQQNILSRKSKIRCVSKGTQEILKHEKEKTKSDSKLLILQRCAPTLIKVGIQEEQRFSLLNFASEPLNWEMDKKHDEKPLLNLSEWEDEFNGHKKTVGQVWEEEPEQWREDVEMKLEYLLGLGLNARQVTEVILKCPQLLRFSLKVIQKPIEYIKSIGIDQSSIAKIILTEPRLLCFQVEEHLIPAIEYMESMGVPRSSIGVLAVLNPTMLAAAVEEKRRLDRTSFLLSQADSGLNRQAKMMALEKADDARKTLAKKRTI